MLAELLCAFALDLLVGDPAFGAHPVRLMGGLLEGLRRLLEPMARKTLGGAVLVASAALVAGALAAGISYAGRLLPIPLGFNPLLAVLVFFLFCNRDMLRESRAVYERLAADDLEGARARLSRIVGRDTEDLDARGIIRATVETVVENIVDGFTSPLFYLLLGGAACGYVFKTVSTVDSMFGYRTERFERFGKVGARLDDALNYIPARLNVLFMWIASGFSVELLRAVLRFGGAHPSPNSAIAESAFAGHLGVALGGPSMYGGVRKEKPWLGTDRLPPQRLEDPRLILEANAFYLRVVFVTLAAGAAAAWFFDLPLLLGGIQ